MRILFVTAHYPPDFTSGATLQVQRLAEQIAAAGHEVAVVAGSIRRGLDDGAVIEEVIDGVVVHWLGTASRIDQDVDENWLNEHATTLVARVFDTFRPDVLHAHTLQTLGADLLTVAAAAGVPTVVTMHDFWWWCPRLFLVDQQLRPCPLDTTSSGCPCAATAAWRHDRAARLRQVLDGVDQVLVPSQAVRDVVVANGLAAERVDVDENDVDGAVIAPTRSPWSGDVRFLYVGGDHPLKGRDVLNDAAASLRSVAGWRLAMFGVPAPIGGWWRRRDRRISHHPSFSPSAGARVFGDADVLIIPSVARESFSIAAREALGSGLAVLTSDCLGPTEVVIDGENGLIVPIGDAGALARAMRRLIDDHGFLDRLQGCARRSAPHLRAPADHASSLLARYQLLVPG